MGFATSLLTFACTNDDSGSDDEVGDGDGDTSGDGDGDTSGDGDGDPGDGDGDPGDGDGDPGDEPDVVAGCDDASFYEVPADPAERGPWAVGAVTTVIDGVTTEIWYPAQWGSEAGAEPIVYDIRYALPPSEQGKISDEKNPPQECDCYRELPIDAQHGPYPVVVFVHGTASWRTQSLTQMTHWASRGFVVVSSDHLGLWLADSLALACGGGGNSQDLSGDTDKVLAALANPSGDLAFLAGVLDTDRVAISGHSAGGSAAASQTNKPGVRVSIPMASGQPVQTSAALESSLLLGGLADGVVAYSSTQNGYASSPTPKRLVGIENAGHLAFSDICEIENDDGQDILEVALEAGVCGAQLAGLLFDCDPNFIDPLIGKAIINYSTTAVLEQALKCVDGPDLFADLQTLYPAVAEYQEAL
ncbi:MAG: hypothetical protein R6X02_31190 [Enhygromyxa sp.]